MIPTVINIEYADHTSQDVINAIRQVFSTESMCMVNTKFTKGKIEDSTLMFQGAQNLPGVLKIPTSEV
jgi:hypothetical protein